MKLLHVKNWRKFQHYKGRTPPWIKLERALLDDFDFACLPLASKALAPMIWLLASESEGGEIRDDVSWIAFRLRWPESDVQEGLTPLIEKGFLIRASNALADCKQDACAEVEADTEIETTKDDDDAREPSPPDNFDDQPVPGEQDLPAWVPRRLWREFYRHRAVIRKPLSIPGQRQVVKRLTELRGNGADIGASLEQTMAAGLAIPVVPRNQDHPGESHANRSQSRKLSACERTEQRIREERAKRAGVARIA